MPAGITRDVNASEIFTEHFDYTFSTDSLALSAADLTLRGEIRIPTSGNAKQLSCCEHRRKRAAIHITYRPAGGGCVLRSSRSLFADDSLEI